MLVLRRVLVLWLVFLLPVQSVLGWFEGGHNVIAVLAFDLLQPEEQSRLLSLLKAHPRVVEDFVPPAGIIDQVGLAHWTFGRAAYWPDVARSQTEFNRPNWHFQLGASIVLGEGVKVPDTPGPLPADANLQTQELHIAQAIELCRRTLRGTGPDSDKAIAICWLAHLVADAHQPCHAGSLYAPGIFPEGDRGANWIPTKQSKNMHALWDGLLGALFDAGDIARRAREIRSSESLWQTAAVARTNLDPLQWLKESAELGNSHVYTPEVIDAITAAQRAGFTRMEMLDLPENYLKAAGGIAQQRAAMSAHRLAAILAEDLKPSATPQ